MRAWCRDLGFAARPWRHPLSLLRLVVSTRPAAVVRRATSVVRAGSPCTDAGASDLAGCSSDFAIGNRKRRSAIDACPPQVDWGVLHDARRVASERRPFRSPRVQVAIPRTSRYLEDGSWLETVHQPEEAGTVRDSAPRSHHRHTRARPRRSSPSDGIRSRVFNLSRDRLLFVVYAVMVGRFPAVECGDHQAHAFSGNCAFHSIARSISASASRPASERANSPRPRDESHRRSEASRVNTRRRVVLAQRPYIVDASAAPNCLRFTGRTGDCSGRLGISDGHSACCSASRRRQKGATMTRPAVFVASVVLPASR